jgi:hypothetical protein
VSTEKHDLEQDVEAGEARDLAREALALPREIEAPRALWQGIEARIEAKRRRTLLLRRGVTGASVFLAAAVVVLAIRSKQPRTDGPGPAPIQSEARLVLPVPTAPLTPRPRATEDPAAPLFPEEATYRAALSALAPEFEARKSSLPEKDGAAISASLRAIDTAILVTRGSLSENPDDDDLRAELGAEYEQKIDTMNDVLAWTTRS